MYDTNFYLRVTLPTKYVTAHFHKHSIVKPDLVSRRGSMIRVPLQVN